MGIGQGQPHRYEGRRDPPDSVRDSSHGSCFGSYGEITQPIPNGSFSIAGTYTQLTGVYPGKIQYAANYSGLVQGDRMSITITVPAPAQTIGPFPLAYGLSNTWTPCLYP